MRELKQNRNGEIIEIPPPLPLTADSLRKAIRENPQASISPSLVRESGLERASRLSPQPQYGVFKTDNPRTLHRQNDADIAFIEDWTKPPIYPHRKEPTPWGIGRRNHVCYCRSLQSTISIHNVLSTKSGNQTNP